MDDPTAGHIVKHIRRPDGELEVRCSCGAMWTHKQDEINEKIESIYKSHLGYFNRPKMETL